MVNNCDKDKAIGLRSCTKTKMDQVYGKQLWQRQNNWVRELYKNQNGLGVW